METIKRMWVNQPSTLQPLHRLHGVRVLAHADTDRTMRAYFLSGGVISMQIPREALSEGWPETSKSAADEDGASARRDLANAIEEPEGCPARHVQS